MATLWRRAARPTVTACARGRRPRPALAAPQRGLAAGIVGVPNVGKSTLFNALTQSRAAEANNFPFCTIEPNVGRVLVPDPTLGVINRLVRAQRVVYPEMRLVDIAGLVRGASQNAGLGNKFLEHIRQVDAIVHCVRCFHDVNVTHVEGTVDPARDVDIIDTELVLSDGQTLENALVRLQRKAKAAASPEDAAKRDVLARCMDVLGKEQPVRSIQWPEADRGVAAAALKGLGLLTAKPVLYVANIDEHQMADLMQHDRVPEEVAKLQQHLQAKHSVPAPPDAPSSATAALHAQGIVPVVAHLEAELSAADEAERQELLASLGMSEPALAPVARLAFRKLGLQSFYTAGQKEVRAWPIRIGSTAVQAARAIHSDIERGFIRAEVYTVEDLERHQSEAQVRKAGLVRSEGKGYVLQASDIVHFLFNV